MKRGPNKTQFLEQFVVFIIIALLTSASFPVYSNGTWKTWLFFFNLRVGKFSMLTENFTMLE